MAAKRVKKSSRLIKKQQKQTASNSGWLNLFRIGESYSSLVLGIIVVIITTILLVLLVRDRNITTDTNMNQNISFTNTDISTATISSTVTGMVNATSTVKPTVPPTNIPTNRPTTVPTNPPTLTKVQPTSTVPTKNAPSDEKLLTTHTVVNGENLWTIAEKYYRSGYNWVDISRVNNLNNPGVIKAGSKLKIPAVKEKTATVSVEKPTESVYGPKINGTTYKIEKGDHLWGIAVRAFNDGYKWVEIAKINNITTPNVIQPGLVLKLPRTSSQ